MGFETDLQLWGWSVDGQPDIAAIICEERWRTTTWDGPAWDYDEDYLNHITMNGERAADKYALWWVCEQQRRNGYGDAWDSNDDSLTS